MRSSRTPICRMKTILYLTPLTLSSRVLGYGARDHPPGLNLMLTHSLGHQPSGFGFAISLSDYNSNLYLQFFTDCAAEDCSATLVEIADELSDPLFNQLIAFGVLTSASLYSGSLGGTVLLRRTNQRLIDCFFPHLLIHFLQGFTY
ncbi:hypothetical protein H5410_015340 [Solanum commersonii]|uniref:Uncharacterized protein n=1 Tax=Solanum commersonii TaxID=4109 RepID=A0A9J5ZU43_SOLCO|nr:hypothetical protein H5410_015340 [Solanum commersonii]